MIVQGNSIKIPLADNSVHCVVTSPPYWNLRDYGIDNQIGLEPTINDYIAVMMQVFREVWRVLRPDGVCWMNLGDSYATSKNGRSAKDTKTAGKDDRTFRDKPFSVTELPAKNLIGMPWRVALALQDDGWILRSDIIWAKPNSMPESVEDRPSKSHEYIFMLVKSPRYYYDAEAIKEAANEAGKVVTLGPKSFSRGQANGAGVRPSGNALNDTYQVLPSRNRRSVWTIPTESFSGAHYATFPRKLVEPMILSATSAKGVCPECGAPWKRLMEKTGEIKRRWSSNDRPTRDDNWRQDNGRDTQGVYKTTGWQPTCKCIQKRAPNPSASSGHGFGMKGSELLELADEVAKEFAPIPAVIFDPFCGSGTVGAVARELGRRFIGIDLSAKYLLENALPRAEKLTSQGALNQLPLFAPGGMAGRE